MSATSGFRPCFISALLVASVALGCASHRQPRAIVSGTYQTEQARLSGSSFHKVFLDNARFDDVNLSGSTFNNVNLSGARYQNVNLSNAHFDDIKLAGTQFKDVDLSGVEIQHAELKGMKIDGVLVTDLLAAYHRSPTPAPPR